MHHTLVNARNDLVNSILASEKEYQKSLVSNIDKLIHLYTKELHSVKIIFQKIEKPSSEDEIYYFKNIKCHLLAYIYYWNMIKELEIHKPGIKSKKLKQYYLDELIKVKHKIKHEDRYYSYFKSNATHFDEKFFMRIKTDVVSTFSNTIIEIDHNINTPYIYIFSHVQALDLFKNFLKEKIKSFNITSSKTNPQISNITWTSSKSSLIELIYALHSSGTFNNGQADIKDIAEIFETYFNIDLGQYNRIFFDIKSRKINKTKFIDTLKEALINRIKSAENELFF